MHSPSDWKRSLIYRRNFALLKAYGLWVSACIIFFRSGEFFASQRVRISRKLTSPRAWILFLVSLALTAGPSSLYLLERSRFIEKERAYRLLNASTASEQGVLLRVIEELLFEEARLRSALLEAGMPVYAGGELRLRVIATGYSSSRYETDSTPYLTAANTNTRPGIIALSRDLLRPYTPDAPFSFGDRIRLLGIGDFIVEDSMHGRWKRRVDIWFPSREEALHFGKRKVYISKPVEETSFTFESERGEYLAASRTSFQ